MTAVSELIDARIPASEARLGGEFRTIHEQLLRHIDQGRAEIAARFDAMDARMGYIESRMDHIEQQNRTTLGNVRNNVWGAAAFIVGSIIAIVALLATVAPYAFDKGQDTARTIHADVVAEIAAERARR